MNKSFAKNYYMARIVPALTDNTTANTGWVYVGGASRAVFILLVGATDITLDAKLQQASDSSGTGAKDITGAAITQYTATDDSKEATIDIDPAVLDHTNGFGWVRGLVTVGDGTLGANIAGVLLVDSRHKPPTQAASYFQAIEVT